MALARSAPAGSAEAYAADMIDPKLVDAHADLVAALQAFEAES
jgi:hypothetical protein